VPAGPPCLPEPHHRRLLLLTAAVAPSAAAAAGAPSPEPIQEYVSFSLSRGLPDKLSQPAHMLPLATLPWSSPLCPSPLMHASIDCPPPPVVTSNGMPLLIHMTFKDKGRFSRHHMLAIASWARENPDHVILMYDDADLLAYMR